MAPSAARCALPCTWAGPVSAGATSPICGTLRVKVAEAAPWVTSAAAVTVSAAVCNCAASNLKVSEPLLIIRPVRVPAPASNGSSWAMPTATSVELPVRVRSAWVRSGKNVPLIPSVALPRSAEPASPAKRDKSARLANTSALIAAPAGCISDTIASAPIRLADRSSARSPVADRAAVPVNRAGPVRAAIDRDASGRVRSNRAAAAPFCNRADPAPVIPAVCSVRSSSAKAASPVPPIRPVIAPAPASSGSSGAMPSARSVELAVRVRAICPVSGVTVPFSPALTEPRRGRPVRLAKAARSGIVLNSSTANGAPAVWVAVNSASAPGRVTLRSAVTAP